jgi:pimeloyl-ACP methyl ester carboxylesterase
MAPPSSGYGLTLLLHAWTGTYNQFANGVDWTENLGQRGTGSIVLTPEARGPDGWYYGLDGVDAFEAWADVAAHYQLDPSYSAIDGYSMGGYASYKLAAEFPDLFARGHATVGPPGAGAPATYGVATGTGILESSQIPRVVSSLRNVPFMMFYAGQDELVGPSVSRTMIPAFDNLGYRYEWDLFNPAEHGSIFTMNIFVKDATFLGEAKVDPNPPHVTYAVNPVWDAPQYGFAGNHAYWVSGVTLLQQSGKAPLGTIDVRSEGFGLGDPPLSALTPTYGVDSAAFMNYAGGYAGDTTYEGVERTWGAAPRTPVADKLDISASNIASVTLDPQRARVDCRAQLALVTDSPITITLTSCWSRSYSANAAPSASGIGSRLPAGAQRLFNRGGAGR